MNVLASAVAATALHATALPAALPAAAFPAITLPPPFDTLPTPVLIGLAIWIPVAIILLVVALVAWFRTPPEHMPPPNRWVWLALLLVQIAGPIAFLVLRTRADADAAARESLAAAEARRTTSQDDAANTHPAQSGTPAPTPSASDAVDLLYGDRHG